VANRVERAPAVRDAPSGDRLEDDETDEVLA
jgi:hypothetical protein